jgi:hypothetical protein
MDDPAQYEARTRMDLTSDDLNTAMAEVMRLAAPVSDQWIVTALDGASRGSIVWQGRAAQCRVIGVREVTFVLLDPAVTDKGGHRLSHDRDQLPERALAPCRTRYRTEFPK